jgi:hypothetical protein
MWSQKSPETVSEVVNYKNFLGEHAPRPPYFGYGAARDNFPPLRKNPVLIPVQGLMDMRI